MLRRTNYVAIDADVIDVRCSGEIRARISTFIKDDVEVRQRVRGQTIESHSRSDLGGAELDTSPAITQVGVGAPRQKAVAAQEGIG